MNKPSLLLIGLALAVSYANGAGRTITLPQPKLMVLVGSCTTDRVFAAPTATTVRGTCDCPRGTNYMTLMRAMYTADFPLDSYNNCKIENNYSDRVQGVAEAAASNGPARGKRVSTTCEFSCWKHIVPRIQLGVPNRRRN